jgi:hypothetical protein
VRSGGTIDQVLAAVYSRYLRSAPRQRQREVAQTAEHVRHLLTRPRLQQRDRAPDQHLVTAWLTW